MVTGILWPAFAGLALLAKPFIVTVYGEAWEAAAVPLTYLAISSMVLVSITMSWELCTVTGNLRTQTRVEAVRATCSVPLFIGGCLISLEAVAFSRIIDAVLAVALYGHHLGKMTGTTILDVRRVYAQGAALTIAAIAPAALLLAIKSDGQPMPAILISSVLLGVLLWVILLFILKHPLSREVIVTLGNRFPRLAQLLPG
jgi:O-antigen/teichoic acid export membrane protein